MIPARRLVPFLALACAACSTAASSYHPVRVLPGELTVHYDEGFEISAGRTRLTGSAERYAGLADFVGCVPAAREHAEAAQSLGTTVGVLKGFSIAFSIGGLGGLAGVAFKGKDDGAMAGLLVAGIAVELAAVALGAGSLGAKSHAHGHALDAVNLYNDAAGSLGGACPAAARRTTSATAAERPATE